MTVQVNEGWEQRLEQIKKDHEFLVIVSPPQQLEVELSDFEWIRLSKKIQLVTQAAQVMLWEFLKGTVKYPHDSWSEEDYEAALIQETAGLVCYSLLAKAAKKGELPTNGN